MLRRQLDQRIVVAVVYVCGMLMNSLDSTIVNVALATLSREFRVPTTSIDAVVIGYIVSLAVFIPASGWLGDRFGTKRIFLTALAIFTAASALCGIAGSFEQLVISRVLQGVGGGMLTPVGIAMLYRTFPPEERVRASRILMFATILGPALGPLIGGFLINTLSWRWAFYVNLPIGLAAFLFGLIFLHEHREPTAGRFDIPGFLLAGSGFALVIYALTTGPARGWTAPVTLACLLVGLAIVGVFAVVETHVAEPMVQLRLLTNRLFRTTSLVTLFASSGFMGTLFLVPLFLQEVRGASPLASGLTTFPEALGVVCSTQIVARLYPRIGPRRLMSCGLIGVATMIALLCTVQTDTNLWVVRLLMFMVGVGMAYVFLPAQAAGFATISRAATGRASTLSTVQRQLGGALGVALTSSVLAAVSGVHAAGTPPSQTAFRAAFLAAATLSIIASCVALGIPDRDAAATMRPRTPRDAPTPAPQEALTTD